MAVHTGAMVDIRARRAIYAMRACIVATCLVLPTTVLVFGVVAFGTPAELIVRRRARAVH